MDKDTRFVVDITKSLFFIGAGLGGIEIAAQTPPVVVDTLVEFTKHSLTTGAYFAVFGAASSGIITYLERKKSGHAGDMDG